MNYLSENDETAIYEFKTFTVFTTYHNFLLDYTGLLSDCVYIDQSTKQVRRTFFKAIGKTYTNQHDAPHQSEDFS